MAGRNTVSQSIAAAMVVAAVLAGLVPLIIFALAQGGMLQVDAYLWGVLWFTLKQAGLSTILSVVPATFVARALARRQFIGRGALLSLFAVPLSLPVIVAVLGITEVLGNSGWFGGFIPLYGLGGILSAHVFFNLPLATRLFLEATAAIPAENHRLAAQLGLSGFTFFRLVEWPVLSSAWVRISSLVFLLCAASFVIVLTLGGGPAATTLEVAIYQSLRVDFDVARAVSLSFIQILLCGVLVVLAGRIAIDATPTAALRLQVIRYDGKSLLARLTDMLVLSAAALLVVPPLLAVLASGVAGFEWNASLPIAALTSLFLALCAAFLCLALAWPIGRRDNATMRVVALLGLIVPPAVLATGWFVAFKGWEGGIVQAVSMIIVLNALMALPFAVSTLAPSLARLSVDHDRLCDQLGLTGFTRLRVIDVPAMQRPLFQALLFAFVLSLGDLTAVTLLGTQGLLTLPSLISQQMGNYRGSAAGGTALFLAILCYGLTLLAQRLGRTP